MQFLTDYRFRSRDDLEKDDIRLLFPRFTEENFPKNVKLADTLADIAKKRFGATASQLALAWIIAEHPNCKPTLSYYPLQMLIYNSV
jgi:aryl-alcohol dehydrogenase-like predicted oxidoreductase